MSVKEKISAAVNHPYAAPVTEFFRGIYRIARLPIAPFAHILREAYVNDYGRYGPEDTPFPVRVGKAAVAIDSGPYPFIAGFMGGILGGIAGASAAATAAQALGAAVGIAAAVAGAGIGAVLGPAALAVSLGAAAATAGIFIGGVPGIFRGFSMISEYHRDKEAYRQARAKLPAATPAKDDAAKKIAPLLARFNQLSPAHRDSFVRMMNDEYQGALKGRAAQIAQAIEVLPEGERAALEELLKSKLKSAFTPVAAPAPEAEDRPIVAPRRASFRRHHERMGVAA